MTALPRLLVLTDRGQLPHGSTLQSALEPCAGAGLTHVVLRELDLGDDARAVLVDQLTVLGLSVLAAHRHLPGCHGVHVAADQPAPSRPEGARWGRSCHSAAEVGRAAAEGATWVTLSPYARTESKPLYGPPLPAVAFTGHDLPVFALGGITPANATEARGAGAHGVAVMGAVMRADDPAAVVSALLEAVAA